MTVNSETNVIQISPKMRGAMRHHAKLSHRFKGVRQLDLPANLPEKFAQERILRELLDESHKRIRLLEAQIERLGSALIEATTGRE